MTRSECFEAGPRAWSYDTCIKDVLPDGRSIGNATYYSATTSHHQSMVGAKYCAVVVGNVPKNTSDLAAWYENNHKAELL